MIASGHAAHTPDDALVAFWRDERVIVLAHLVRRARGDVDAAEDALAEAVGRAVPHWRAHGVPERPGAWLLTVARNVLTDRDRTHRGDVVALDDLPLAAPDVVQHVPDDRLALLFTCCHPALAPAAQVCLALRTIGGLTNREIARATLEPEPTVAQRVLRATRKIRDAGIPLDLPAGDAREVRIDVTRQILYLLFNEGYGATSGTDYVREALCETAIALGRQLTALDAEGAESRGLLALMLLHHARRHARLDADGVPITLEEQDRRRWDRALIAEGEAILDDAMAMGRSGPYQVQAAIAALHATAASSAATDWAQISLLYSGLRFWWPTAVVELNAAVAMAMERGPEWGLVQLDGLASSGALAGYHLLPAARADLLRRTGRLAEAQLSYREALALARTEGDRRYLARRLDECERSGDAPRAMRSAP